MTNFISSFNSINVQHTKHEHTSYQGQQVKHNKLDRAYNKNKLHDATFNNNRNIRRKILMQVIVDVMTILYQVLVPGHRIVLCNLLRTRVGSNGNGLSLFGQDNHSNCRPLPYYLRPKIPVISSVLIILNAGMKCTMYTACQLSYFFQHNIFGLAIQQHS